jgi:glycosyltransferase involved in cell wall biosynthesis
MRSFWPDEMVSAKVLKKTSVIYFLLKKSEKLLINRSYCTIVLTNAARKYLLDKKEINNKIIYTIPTCVNHKKFRRSPKNFFMNSSKSITIGTFGTISSGWFLLEEFVSFVTSMKSLNPDIKIRVISQDNPKKILSALDKYEIKNKDIQFYSAQTEDMPDEISKFDLVIMFFVANFSKLGSAPTRFGEALASGIPCVVNSGVGDLKDIVIENNVGVVVSEFSKKSILKGCSDILNLLNDESLKSRCIKTSYEHFSLDVAEKYYQKIYGS